MVTFEQARRSVSAEWPDYDMAPYGYETDDSWLLLLLPETVGGRVAAVSKATGSVRWINENAAEYTQQRLVGSRPDGEDPSLDDIQAMADEDDDVERAAGHDITPGHDELHHYWTRGPGRARWEGSPTPWRTLYALVTKAVRKNGRAVSPEQIKRWVSRWFIEVKHYAAGSDRNRVEHGHPPRGHRVGPG